MSAGQTKNKPKLNTSGRQPVVRDEHGLTPRERVFADSYLVNGNGTRSGILAGCTPTNAASWATDTLKKPAVARYIEKCRQAILDKLAIEREDVIRELWWVVRSDVSDYVRRGRELVAAEHADPGVTKAVSRVKIKSKTYVDEDKGEVTEHEIEFALHPKVAAADLMMKRLDMYPRAKQIEIDEDDDGTLIIKEVVE